ncbi:MAG: hypothetical protein AAGC71_06785 [Pseudomonadota bacterium]
MPRWLRKELLVFAILVLLGLFVLPVAIYLTGMQIFAGYAGGGSGDFLRRFFGAAASGSPAVWFLILAPYATWQCLRLAWAAVFWRRSTETTTAGDSQ